MSGFSTFYFAEVLNQIKLTKKAVIYFVEMKPKYFCLIEIKLLEAGGVAMQRNNEKISVSLKTQLKKVLICVFNFRYQS